MAKTAFGDESADELAFLACKLAAAPRRWFGDISFTGSFAKGDLTMWPTKQDFQLQASNFDLGNGLNFLRIICGLFLFPHVMGKFAAGAASAATVGFFAKAGFQPAEVWVYITAVLETLVGVALVLGICTRFAALGGCALLLIAVYSLQTVKGFGWTWNTGGYEYPVFWAIASLAVALEAWKGHAVGVVSAVPANHITSWQRAPLVH
jgi:putative oxidoreductase